MNDYIEKRAVIIGEYIFNRKATVRDAAAKFGISKSTVHKDVTARLEKIDKILHKKVAEILAENKSERHIRGGLATKRKYENKRNYCKN